MYRRDKEGNPRELHIEKGVMASVTKKQTERIIPKCSDGTRLIASCEYFAVKELCVNGLAQMECHKESYQALVCVDGCLELINDNDKEILKAGQTVFLPAVFRKYSYI